ncbi:MAG: SH3 domain-containing protein [Propionicimonas sp.]
MYQPRRVADPVAPAEASLPTRSAGPALRSAGPAQHAAARRAAPTVADRLFSKGAISLAAVTVVATAGAVILGSNGGSAVALGANVPDVAASPNLAAAVTDPAAVTQVTDTRVTDTVRSLTADELAAPVAAAKATKVASKALVSLSRLYTTGSLNVRSKADVSGELLGSLDGAVRVSATADVDGKYRRIEFNDGYAWVLSANLSDAAPVQAAGTTWGSCPRGSGVERKLRKDTVHIYRSVCALFPGVNSYGGWRAGGMAFHKNGRALDIMLTPGAESALGYRIANYLISHAKDFNVDHIIFEQKIWTPSTPHWRHMADRGSITANHFNHVHVAIRA